MRRIEEAELSAFLDRELDPVRASEVTAALSSDAALRAQFEMLAGMDAQWRTTARTAGFRPRLTFAPQSGYLPWFLTAALVAALGVVVRFVPKAGGAAGIGLTLQVLALGAAVAWVIRTVTMTSRP